VFTGGGDQLDGIGRIILVGVCVRGDDVMPGPAGPGINARVGPGGGVGVEQFVLGAVQRTRDGSTMPRV
jgi:hypothetical protein